LIRESDGREVGIYVRDVDGPTALYPDLAWRVTCDRQRSQLTKGKMEVLTWLVRVRESTSMRQRMGFDGQLLCTSRGSEKKRLKADTLTTRA
jgi:hypothetical protein